MKNRHRFLGKCHWNSRVNASLKKQEPIEMRDIERDFCDLGFLRVRTSIYTWTAAQVQLDTLARIKQNVVQLRTEWTQQSGPTTKDKFAANIHWWQFKLRENGQKWRILRLKFKSQRKIQVGALLRFSILSTEQVCDQISEISTSIPGLLCYKNCLKKDLV